MSTPDQAIVLAAGEGRRLRPTTLATPKPLVPFLNVPLLLHTLVALRDAGVRRVAVNAWHRAPALVAFAAADPLPGLGLHVRVEASLLGTGGGLRNLLDWIQNGPLFVLAGDVLAPFDLPALARRHRAARALATMTVVTDPDPDRYGAVELDGDDMLTDIIGRLHRPGCRRVVNASAHLLERSFVEELPPGPSCLVRDGYLPSLQRGCRVAAFVHHGPWHELGTPQSLLRAQAAALAGDLPVDPSLLARGGTRCDGNLVHASARVASDAVLQEGTVVGPRARVAAGARLERCLVLEDGVVAAGARHRNAILAPARAGAPLRDG